MSDNGDRPATKADLAQLKVEIQEAIHDSETRLLTAFYGWAQATQKHFADLDRADFSLRERLDSLENRLLSVEKRLDMPPAA